MDHESKTLILTHQEETIIDNNSKSNSNSNSNNNHANGDHEGGMILKSSSRENLENDDDERDNDSDSPLESPRPTSPSPPPLHSTTTTSTPGTSYYQQTPCMTKSYKWIMPLVGATFLCFCMVLSIMRPYEVIIERRTRPMRLRKLISDFNFLFVFGGSNDSGGDNGIMDEGDYAYDSTSIDWNDQHNNIRDNNDNDNYAGNRRHLENNNNNSNGDDNDATINYVANNKRQMYYDNYEEDEGDDAVDDAVDDNNVEAYYDNSSAYYNDTDNANNTYYLDDDEEVVDDFFRYIDDYVEIKYIFPLEWSDYVGLVCTSLSIILSLGGGIGPGAVLVAVFIIVMDFDPKVAIPLSCMTGLGVTTIATLINMRRRHPLSDRPLIDWDLILIMEPLVLFGAVIGTYINKIIDTQILVVLLVLLLSIISHHTLKRARRMHHAEELYIKRMLWAKQKRKAKEEQKRFQAPILATLPDTNYNYGKPVDGNLVDGNLVHGTPVDGNLVHGKLEEASPPFIPKVHPSTQNLKDTNAPNSEPLMAGNQQPDARPSLEQKMDSNLYPSDASAASSYASSFRSFIVLRKEDAESVKSSLLEEEADPLPPHKITYIFTMFLGVIGFNVFKGGAGFESPIGIVCGSVWFWIVELLCASWLGICTVLAGRYLLKRHAIKEAVGFDYVRGDIRWDVRTILMYPAVMVFAGLVSGMFGIGVAVIITPMLVGIGMNPQVAAATCACMNFFTGLAATSSFVVLGSLSLYHQYAATLFFVGVVSLFLGKWVMSFSLRSTKIKKNKRLERHSYMAYSMGLVVLVSALSMTVEALVDVMNHSYDDDAVDGICDSRQVY